MNLYYSPGSATIHLLVVWWLVAGWSVKADYNTLYGLPMGLSSRLSVAKLFPIVLKLIPLAGNFVRLSTISFDRKLFPLEGNYFLWQEITSYFLLHEFD